MKPHKYLMKRKLLSIEAEGGAIVLFKDAHRQDEILKIQSYSILAI